MGILKKLIGKFTQKGDPITIVSVSIPVGNPVKEPTREPIKEKVPSEPKKRIIHGYQLEHLAYQWFVRKGFTSFIDKKPVPYYKTVDCFSEEQDAIDYIERKHNENQSTRIG